VAGFSSALSFSARRHPRPFAENRFVAVGACGVFLWTLALLTPGLWRGYWGRDEAEYAGVAHAMNATGDYLVPHLFGRLYPDKPPLSEWLTAVSFRFLGEREASGRLPHVALAAASAALLLLLGARLFDLRRALIASAIFSTSFLFLIYGRLLLTDSDLLFFTLASLFFLLPVLEGETESARAAAAAGIALGLAILAKGPVALLAPSLFCAGYLAAGAGPGQRYWRKLVLALAVAFAVAAPWFLMAARATAGQSLRAFLLHENLHRFLRPQAGHRAPFFSVLVVLWLGFFPWSGLFLLPFRRGALRRSPVRWGLLFCAGGSLVFFSLSATKLPHYLLPATPAIALLLADLASPSSERKRRIVGWGAAMTGSLLFAGAVAAVCVAAQAAAFGLLVAFGAAALLSLTVPLLLPGQRAGPIGLASAVLASAVIALGAPPVLDRLRSTDRLGRAARQARLAGEPIGGFRIHEAGLTYYAGAERSPMWKTAAEIGRAAVSSRTGSALVWLDSADAVSLARVARLRVRLLARGPSLVDPRVRDFLALYRVRPGYASSNGR
jgi:4-amino-4-deoxy-L-arabinose transferase-like glycosyltransferase